MTRQILMCGVQYDRELREGRARAADLAPVAKRLGLAGVEYREVYWHDKARELPAVRDQLAQLGLRGTYATFNTLFSRDPEVRARLLEDIRDARALGSSLIRIFRGELPGTGPLDAAMWDGGRAAIGLAGELGLTVALENFSGKVGNKGADIVGMLQTFDLPHVGTNIDVSNYVLNDEDPVAAIRTLARRIRYVHLKDVQFTPERKIPTYLGAGTLPYRDILAALEESGQDFPLCFEFGGGDDPEETIRKSLAFLKSIAGA